MDYLSAAIALRPQAKQSLNYDTITADEFRTLTATVDTSVIEGELYSRIRTILNDELSFYANKCKRGMIQPKKVEFAFDWDFKKLSTDVINVAFTNTHKALYEHYDTQRKFSFKMELFTTTSDGAELVSGHRRIEATLSW